MFGCARVPIRVWAAVVSDVSRPFWAKLKALGILFCLSFLLPGLYPRLRIACSFVLQESAPCGGGASHHIAWSLIFTPSVLQHVRNTRTSPTPRKYKGTLRVSLMLSDRIIGFNAVDSQSLWWWTEKCTFWEIFCMECEYHSSAGVLIISSSVA